MTFPGFPSSSQSPEDGIKCRVPFYDVETGNAVLSPDGVQVTAEDGHAHAGATRAGGRHVAAPLIGLRVVSGRGGAETRCENTLVTLESKPEP